ncbi:SMP-30/gluconolactonase/LRE family protein [Corallococcus llansteffanensis]|uniref:SMP-30/Gluconolactonase/LRE-like region domain-containing protein n=1 Tax=Corallococcus llansteffanensis TaxID=2316731 RepID=A0A3A8PLF2_9BACT|nr:hypothetical protein [Corallococcus llansteffanensis]RKH53352.1 hypothetical protein D7V93_26830 [Corallococcus llansteffanensis]
MRSTRWLSLLTLVTAVSACEPPPEESARAEVQLPGEDFYPEGIASSSDGTLYVGSVGTGAIARARPGELGAHVFVPGRPAFGIYGLAVDEAHGTLWACTYDDTLPPAQPSHLAAYGLATGELKASHPLPGSSGFCNDIALDAAGNVYATDTLANTVVRLAVGGNELTTWAEDEAFAPVVEGDFTLNGIAYDGAGTLYVVKSDTGTLFSIAIQADGSAGAPVTIPVEPALEAPDGLEWLDAQRLLVVENTPGRVSVVTHSGGSGTKEVIANGFGEPTTAALTDDGAWVLEAQLGFFFGAPGVPSLPFRVHRVVVPQAPLLP